MAIAFTNLGASANPDFAVNPDQTSYTNTSWGPPSTGIICCWVLNVNATGGSTTLIDSMTGNGITWSQITTAEITPSLGNKHRLTLMAAYAAGSSSGANTIDYGTDTQIAFTALFFQITGANDGTGNIADAFTNLQTNNGTAATSGSVTLNSPASTDNRPISCFFHNVQEATTPQTNWTELDDLANTATARAVESQYRGDAFDTAAGASWTTSSAWGAIAAEVIVAPAISGPRWQYLDYSYSGS